MIQLMTFTGRAQPLSTEDIGEKLGTILRVNSKFSKDQIITYSLAMHHSHSMKYGLLGFPGR